MQLTDILGRPLRRFHFSLTNAAFRWYKNPEEQVAGYFLIDFIFSPPNLFIF